MTASTTEALRRELLVERLTDLSTDVLEALKAGLEAEKLICVSEWANCSINGQGDEAQPVGCLFAAAYMHTRAFEERLEDFGSTRALFHELENYEGWDITVAEALDISTSEMEGVISAFDRWGNLEGVSELISYLVKTSYGNREAEQRVLTQESQAALIGMIGSILESRS